MQDLSFVNGSRIRLAHATKADLFWDDKEMGAFHRQFITSSLDRPTVREVVKSAERMAPEGTPLPQAFTMWLLAVHDAHPEDALIEDTLKRICAGTIDIGSFLVKEC